MQVVFTSQLLAVENIIILDKGFNARHTEHPSEFPIMSFTAMVVNDIISNLC
ncbi:hypothetical protein D3C72_2454410 [compost metagenome]